MAELRGFDKAVQIRLMSRPLEGKLPHLAVSAQLRQKSHAMPLSSLPALGFREY
jgi:hypothetical protein